MKPVRSLIGTLFAIVLLLPLASHGADFSISPVRISFAAQQKADIIMVKNFKDTPVSLQLSVMAWTQDDDAGDVTVPTEDIIAFPKLLTIKGGEEQMIRIGKRTTAGEVEKTYRIFIEELPGKDVDPAVTGPVIRTLTRVGIPIFVLPLKEQPSMAIDRVQLSGGQLALTVRNDGNTHFVTREVRVTGHDQDGKPIFQHDIAGWYLLSGHEKRYQIEVPRDVCLQLRQLDMEVVTDNSSRSERIDVTPEMCSP
ncbi:MAG: hypothetical protein A2V90_05745 [Gammaproteobacteria bacterium RBG_16_57_12]|nr:MAG: hypothetical protein A2V90_05745 [Gammaproteobacteria bacterium RBG_16_57_12]